MQPFFQGPAAKSADDKETADKGHATGGGGNRALRAWPQKLIEGTEFFQQRLMQLVCHKPWGGTRASVLPENIVKLTGRERMRILYWGTMLSRVL